MSNDTSSTPASRAPNHPGTLGGLADVFDRRRIAAGADSDGQIFLARPHSVIASVGPKGERRGAVADVIRGLNKEQARLIGERTSFGRSGVVPIDIRRPEEVEADEKEKRGAPRATDGQPAKTDEESTARSEPRWDLARASDVVAQLREAGVPSDFNVVVVGEEAFVGHPLGTSATWAGELAFPGRCVTTSNGTKTILNTAEPSGPPPFLRRPLRLKGRTPPRVLVLDTGLRTLGGAGKEPEHPELANCVVDSTFHDSSTVGAADDEDEPDDDETGTLDFEAGHGTFVSGVVRQICPDAEIRIAGCLSSFGDGDVSTVLDALERGVDDAKAAGSPIDIAVMSFGGFFPNDDATVFEAALRDILGDVVAVAAAGNNFTCRPCFPAALSDVIAVGGLAADGKAWFTNFGGWVDACTPAIDVVSTFFTDQLEQVPDAEPRHYQGWARWSGTSFSAPKVAALIAQEMYLHGDAAKDAWKRLTSHKHFRYPDLGIVFNV